MHTGGSHASGTQKLRSELRPRVTLNKSYAQSYTPELHSEKVTLRVALNELHTKRVTQTLHESYTKVTLRWQSYTKVTLKSSTQSYTQKKLRSGTHARVTFRRGHARSYAQLHNRRTAGRANIVPCFVCRGTWPGWELYVWWYVSEAC